MMPGVTESHPSNVNYKQKYKTLKRKLKFLVYEQECFLEELRKAQRKLLKVSRDKSFLLDRLLQYEKIDDSSSDSDATASSDSDAEGHRDQPGSGKKKKTSGSSVQLPMFAGSDPPLHAGSLGFTGMLPGQASLITNPTVKTLEPTKKKAKPSSKKTSGTAKSVTKSKSPSSSKKTASSLPGVQMTREEIERHLESTHRNKPQFLSIEKVASDLPMEIFSNDNSNVDSDPGEVLLTEDGQEDHDLIIDLPE